VTALTRDQQLAERQLDLIDPTYGFEQAFGFPPMPWQVPYLWDTRNVANLKGRQVGASTAAAALCIRHARHVPGSLAAIVSPSLKQSTEVKLRAKQGLERLEEVLKIDSSTTLGLTNGSRIISLPGSAKSVRGWSATLLVIDEAAFLDPDTFLAVRATVAATGGRVIVQSTPAAPFGHFYDLYTAAEDADTAPRDAPWVRYHVSSEDVDTISAEFLEEERARLRVDEYAQEYQGVFAAPGLGLVDPDRLRSLTLDPPGGSQGTAEVSPWAKLRGDIG
jgi:hypothetical protein